MPELDYYVPLGSSAAEPYDGPPRIQSEDGTHPKMTISTESSNTVLTVPYAPNKVQHAGLAPKYTEVTRPGRTTLILRSNEPQPTMSFDLMVAKNQITSISVATPETAGLIEAAQSFGGSGAQYALRNYTQDQVSVEFFLDQLRGLAGNRQRVRIKLGPSEAGLWRITDLSIDSERRGINNEITVATCSLTLTRAVDVVTKVGPVSGGAKPPAGGKAAPKSGTSASPPRSYVVKRGDTLGKIAMQFYRKSDLATIRKIAAANGIKNVNLIKVGQKLTLP